MAQDYRVALIAIASNEGAYLAQFVFHHLRMGFAPIILITNNSEDDTAAMAARMGERLPDVHHLDGDPLIGTVPAKKFQNTAYAVALDLIANFSLKPDYAMFLDIDEYWVPLSGDSTVSEYIGRHGAPDTMMFNWVAPFKDAAPFSLPFISEFQGYPWPNLKTIWRFGMKITGFNPHNVQSNEIQNEFIASGQALTSRSRTQTYPRHPGNALVIHQMFRSLSEYLAVLDRGNPDDELIFKSNRPGYRFPIKSQVAVDLHIDPKFCTHWHDDFLIWLDDIQLKQMLISGRFNVVHRAVRALKKYEMLSEEERAPYANAFRFVDFDAVRAEIAELLADPDGRIARIP